VEEVEDSVVDALQANPKLVDSITEQIRFGASQLSHDMRYCREIATRSFAVYWSLVLLRRFVTVKPMIRS
jgi:hypothetical protein